MKKVLFLFVLGLIAGISMSGMAQTSSGPFVYEDWTYAENKSGLTLTDYRGNESSLSIPSEINGTTVTQLGKDLFMSNTDLEHVIIPGTVTAIGTNAFNGCTNLQDVQLSVSINKIDTGTFRNCISLREIVLPRAITTVGAYAFYNSQQLSEIYLTSVSSVGESAFENCSSLGRVFVSKRLTSVGGFACNNTPWLEKQTDEFVFIGKGVLLKWNGSGPEVTLPWGTVMISAAFAENDEIEKVTMPDTIRNIGQYAFRNTVNLTQVNIPVYTTTIGASAFEGCKSLKEVKISDSVKSLGSAAFQYCERLEELRFPPLVKTIPSLFLANCPSLKHVFIPDGVTKIDKTSFQGSDLVTLYADPGTFAESFAEDYEIPFKNILKEQDDFLFRRGKNGITIVKYVGNEPVVEVPAKIDGTIVTEIGAAAFQNNNRIRGIILPATLKHIGNRAFSYMENLEFVQIPAGLKSLGSGAFIGSANVKSVLLPRRLSEIGFEPFDKTAETVICTRDDSAASDMLLEMGYVLYSPDFCSEEYNIRDRAAQDQDNCTAGYSENGENTELIQIPEGLTKLTSDMLINAGAKLILFIPDTVTEIDPEILEGRTVTIVGDTETPAETFAAQNNVKFLALIDTW